MARWLVHSFAVAAAIGCAGAGAIPGDGVAKETAAGSDPGSLPESFAAARSWQHFLFGTDPVIEISEPPDRAVAENAAAGTLHVALTPAVLAPGAWARIHVSLADPALAAKEPPFQLRVIGPLGVIDERSMVYREPPQRHGCEGVSRPCDPVVPDRQAWMEVPLQLPGGPEAVGAYLVEASNPALGRASARFRVVPPSLAKAYEVHPFSAVERYEPEATGTYRLHLAPPLPAVRFYFARYRHGEATVEVAVSEGIPPAISAQLWSDEGSFAKLMYRTVQRYRVRQASAAPKLAILWETYPETGTGNRWLVVSGHGADDAVATLVPHYLLHFASTRSE